MTHTTPWRLDGQTIRDANGDVVVSAINPCDMRTREVIVAAVNNAAEPCNIAAMREALVSIRDRVLSGGFDAISPSGIVNICDAALSAPPRNCDVGTAERRNEKWLFRAEQWLVLGLIGFLGATTIILAGAWCYAVATRLRA